MRVARATSKSWTSKLRKERDCSESCVLLGRRRGGHIRSLPPPKTKGEGMEVGIDLV